MAGLHVDLSKIRPVQVVSARPLGSGFRELLQEAGFPARYIPNQGGKAPQFEHGSALIEQWTQVRE